MKVNTLNGSMQSATYRRYHRQRKHHEYECRHKLHRTNIEEAAIQEFDVSANYEITESPKRNTTSNPPKLNSTPTYALYS